MKQDHNDGTAMFRERTKSTLQRKIGRGDLKNEGKEEGQEKLGERDTSDR